MVRKPNHKLPLDRPRSVRQHQDPVRCAHRLRKIMGDQDQSSIVLLYKLSHQLQDLFLNGNIQGRGGLIRDQQLGIGGQGNGNDNPLPHTA